VRLLKTNQGRGEDCHQEEQHKDTDRSLIFLRQHYTNIIGKTNDSITFTVVYIWVPKKSSWGD